MAKKAKNPEDESAQKNWREGDLINAFRLNRIKTYQTPVMQEWLDVEAPELNVGEQYLFDISYNAAFKSIPPLSIKSKFYEKTIHQQCPKLHALPTYTG